VGNTFHHSFRGKVPIFSIGCDSTGHFRVNESVGDLEGTREDLFFLLLDDWI